MQFQYQGKQYDLRLKSRYLPQGIKHIDGFDLTLMLSSTTSRERKQELLQSYLPEALLV